MITNATKTPKPKPSPKPIDILPENQKEEPKEEPVMNDIPEDTEEYVSPKVPTLERKNKGNKRYKNYNSIYGKKDNDVNEPAK